ncbi:MAG: NEW3 domain-containing protein [Candidatus Diapherotrites archaeon]|nr:NEW3 domain-containing protein [Candidatus Diapherotrites archaeon]
MNKAITAVLFFLVLFGAAQASISIIPSARDVSMGRNDTIGLQFEVRNGSADSNCVTFSADPADGYVEAGLSRDSACINGNSSASLTATIHTINATGGTHNLSIIARCGSGCSATGNVRVLVGEFAGGGIEFDVHPTDICLGKEEQISVLVRNNTGKFQDVKLQADNVMLLPYFSPSQISLGSGQEKYVKLIISTSPYSAKGDQTVSLMAITDDEQTKDDIELNIVDCAGGSAAPPFAVSTASGCYVVRKGDTESIPFHVTSLLDNSEQRVYFSETADLSATLETASAFLEARAERTFYVKVTTPISGLVTDYNLSLHISGSDYSVDKGVCIRTRATHFSTVEVLNNNLEIERGSTAVFNVIVRNSGDYNESYTVRLGNPYAKISAGLLATSFSIRRGGSKQVDVNVYVAPDAPIDSYDLNLTVDVNGTRQQKKIHFDIVEQGPVPVPSGEALSIASYPELVRINEGESKTLVVWLQNNASEEMTGVSVKLSGLPEGLSATQETGLSIQPGQNRQVTITLTAAKGVVGDYAAVLSARNSGNSTRKNVQISVSTATQPTEGGFSGMLTGMFALGGDALIGLLLLAVVLALVVLIVRSIEALRRPKLEPWMRQEQ